MNRARAAKEIAQGNESDAWPLGYEATSDRKQKQKGQTTQRQLASGYREQIPGLRR